MLFVADFETTTDANDCRVWGWGIAGLETPDVVELGETIGDFVDRISFQNSVCYFHNLKFDGYFILDHIFQQGYDHKADERSLTVESFTTLIDGMGKFYTVTVKWSNGNKTEFRDSMKKLPMSVRKIAKSFKMEESKGDIDYHTARPVGHRLTDEEKDYLRRDVSIVANAMKQAMDSGMKKLTVASDSLAEYKRLTGEKTFQTRFPVLGDAMDAEIRRAYRGGFTYRDERYGGRVTPGGVTLDVNSLYPAVMAFQQIPYGEPEYITDGTRVTGSHPLTIFSVTFTAKLKPGHIPCIQIKGAAMFAPTEYLTDIPEPTTLMITNVDLALYNDHYDMNIIEYGSGWRFHAALGMFDDYIDKWAAVKAQSVGGLREIAKLHLNSLYGKFATNPNITSKIPTYSEGVVKMKTGPEETRAPVYTAAGVFITSYARDITIRAAQENYATFAYADTDSLHLIRDTLPDNLDIHPTNMGAWKHEYSFDAAYYIRAKAYLERHADGTYTNRIAGLPDIVSGGLTFDDLYDGRVLQGKLNPRAVHGGLVLEDVGFKLQL